MQTTAIEAVPAGQAGQAAGLFSTMRYFGSILGAAGMAAILGGPASGDASMRLLFALLTVSAAGAVLTAWRLPTPSVRPASVTAPTLAERSAD